MIRAGVTALVAAGVFSFAAAAQPGGMRPGPVKTFICPAQVAVKMVAVNPAALGVWKANEGPFTVALDPANPPRVSGSFMTCYYKVGSQQAGFNILAPFGTMKCTPLSNGTGFSCVP